MSSHFWILLGLLWCVIIATRALPFCFAHWLEDKPILKTLEKSMPAYILMLLVWYEINPSVFFHPPYGLPALISLGIMGLFHLIFRKAIVSIFIATGVYIAILILSRC